MNINIKSWNIFKSIFFDIKSFKPYIPLLYPLYNSQKDVFIGWGKKRSGIQAIEYAQKYNTDFSLLEDGFIRSINTTTQNKSFSLVKDNIGIFYDATGPSRLENIILENNNLSLNEIGATKEFMKDLLRLNISKYNSGQVIDRSFLEEKYKIDKDKELILFPLQVKGDLSLTFGLTDSFTIDKIINIALNENPDAVIIVKEHPRFKEKHKPNERVVYIDEDINIISLIKMVSKVYVQSSQVGFEALIAEKKVITFGMPFYAGWGLTDDRCLINPNKEQSLCQKRRNLKVSIETIVYSMYFLYTEYKDPYTLENISAHDALRRMNSYRSKYNLINNDLFFIGISKWKKPFIKRIFKDAKTITFGSELNEVTENQIIVSWNITNREEIQKMKNKSIIIEDGFIRSKGLGSFKNNPLSIVLDSGGIYFDSKSNSDLFKYLNEKENFNQYTLDKGQKVKEILVSSKISKYNSDHKNLCFLVNPKKRKVIFIPGQVEDDASIKCSGNGYSNISLIKEVRKNNPNAFIVYKEHPDVTSGKRMGRDATLVAMKIVDEVVSGVSLHDCINASEEIHTISSLSGLEALILGKKVYCYGNPFYSGWGLTTDIFKQTNRSNNLNLENLLYATYIEYPLYFNYKKNSCSSFSKTIDILSGE